MDTGFVLSLIGTVGTVAGFMVAWRQLRLQARNDGGQVHRPMPPNLSGLPVLVPTGALPTHVRGRQQLLQELRRSLRRPAGQAVILTGAGGMGKSTLAASFAGQAARAGLGRRRRPVWWVSAAEPTVLAHSLMSVAQELGARQADIEAIGEAQPHAPDRLWALLGRARRGWLLVFDNADDPAVLAGPAHPAVAGTPRVPVSDGTGWLRPTRRGLVLVTSRNASQAVWGRHARVLRVGPLEDADAGLVLQDLAPSAGDDTEARQLAHGLGGLPLALRLTGSYLRSDVALRTTFREYLQVLDDRTARPRLLTAEPDIDATPDARAVVMRTWEISLDALASGGAPQARPMLRLLSCFAAAVPIPLTLLAPQRLTWLSPASNAAGPTPGDIDVEHRLEHVLHQLVLLGLVEVRVQYAAGGPLRTLVVHPVIAHSNRAHLLQGATGEASPATVRQTAVDLVLDALDRLDWDRAVDWPQYLLLGPHVEAVLHTVGRTVDQQRLHSLVMATTLAARGHNLSGALTAGERLSRAVLGVLDVLDDDDPARLLARRELAWPVGMQGRPAEAETIYREVLAGLRQAFGDTDPETLTTRNELAWITAMQGGWAEAEASYRQVLDARRRVLGDNHPDTLISRHELAWTIGNQGRGAEAEPILQDILAVRERVHGMDHPRTLQSRHELAWIAAVQSRWAEAEASYRQVLDARRRVLGDTHPDTLTTEYELAWTLAAQGRRRAALAEYRRVLAARRRTLGETHPDTASTRQAIARLRHEQVIPARHQP